MFKIMGHKDGQFEQLAQTGGTEKEYRNGYI
jgi:hypothetical protein